MNTAMAMSPHGIKTAIDSNPKLHGEFAMKHYVILSGIVGGIVGSVFTALLASPVNAQ